MVTCLLAVGVALHGALAAAWGGFCVHQAGGNSDLEPGPESVLSATYTGHGFKVADGRAALAGRLGGV